MAKRCMPDDGPVPAKRQKRLWTWFDYAKCFMMPHSCDTDRVERLLIRLHNGFSAPDETTGAVATGFHWIVKYALYLFHCRGDLQTYVECAACLSLSMKLWDDWCPEEGDGVYQFAMTGAEQKSMGSTEAAMFLNDFGGRILHSAADVVQHWKRCARITSGPVIVDV